MKNLFFTAALLFAAITTANAQSMKVGNVTVTYNAAAAANTSYRLDVATTDNGGTGSGMCKDAEMAIKWTQKLCGCVLTPNEALKVYSIAKQEPPQWLLNNAKVKTL